MIKSRIMRISAIALCLALLAPAAPSVSAQSFSVPVVYKKLPNGLRVVVSENHAAPVVVVELMYRIGFRIEPRNRTGFAHLFEHLMFQGSEHVAKFEHVRIVNENGGTLNGSTRFDHTNYFEVMPSNALELAMWLEADRMKSLKITPETLKNQQDVVSDEVRVNVLNQPYGAFEWLGLPQRGTPTGTTATISMATVPSSRRRTWSMWRSSTTPTTRRTTPCWSSRATPRPTKG